MKKEKSLFIFDIDNTLSDTINVWGDAFDYALDALAKSRGIEREVLEKDIFDNIPEHLKHVPGVVAGKDIVQTMSFAPCLKPKTPEEAAKFEKSDAEIIHNWQQIKQKACPYNGALAALRKIKQSGAKVVLFTDSRESSCVPRLAKMGFPTDLIDGMYVQPDLDKEGKPVTLPVKGKAIEFKEALGDKLIVQGPKTSKPNPKAVEKILKDFGLTDKSKAVMIGDNVRSDGGSGVGAGIDFAWQKHGATPSDSTLKLYERFATSKEYSIAVEGHYKQMNDDNRPTEILEKGMPELLKFYRPVALNSQTKANTNAMQAVIASKKSRGM
ncbi:MAG: HAD family hydrolase [Alphaproteobacteria bacterium]